MTEWTFNLVRGSAHVTRQEPCRDWSDARKEAGRLRVECKCDMVMFWKDAESPLYDTFRDEQFDYAEAAE